MPAKKKTESSESSSDDDNDDDRSSSDKGIHEDEDESDLAPRSKRPYLNIRVETHNGTIFTRDQNGSISISFNPEKNKSVSIGGQRIKNSKQLNGDLIEIGNFPSIS